MNRKKVIIILFIIAIIIASGAFVLLSTENNSLKNISFIYNENQYIATFEGEAVTTSFLLVDSNSEFKNSNESSEGICLLASDDVEFTMDSYTVDTLEKASIFSPYEIYKITISFKPEIKIDKRVNFSRLRIGEKMFDIGSLVIEKIVEQNYPDIGFGTSPFSENHDWFTLDVKNRENSVVIVKEVIYYIGNQKINGITSEMTIDGGQEGDASFRTNFPNNTYAIRPIIVYEYEGEQFSDIAVVATEYVTTLSKKEILDYVKANGK